MDYKNGSNKFSISIKTTEKNISKTYTDSENNIKTLEKIAQITNRSFNDTLKEIVGNFIENGEIYDPCEKKYYSVEEVIENNGKDIL